MSWQTRKLGQSQKPWKPNQTLGFKNVSHGGKLSLYGDQKSPWLPFCLDSKRWLQGAKKVIFTACHSGKLKLTFTSPNIISTSPPKFLMSRMISQLFCKLNSSKYFTCLLGKLRTEFTSPIAKSTSPGLLDTTFFARCGCPMGTHSKVIFRPHKTGRSVAEWQSTQLTINAKFGSRKIFIPHYQKNFTYNPPPPPPNSLLDFPFLQGTDDPNTHPTGISTSVVKTPQPLHEERLSKAFKVKNQLRTVLAKSSSHSNPRSDKHQFSPNIINTPSRKKVMRIEKMITKGKTLWSFIKFSPLIP